MESLWNLSAGQFTGAALALGALLTEGLTPDQQAQLGNLLMLTGQMMVTYSAQILFLQSRWPQEPAVTREQWEQLRRRLEDLERYCAPPFP